MSLCKCEFIEINLVRSKSKGTSVVDLKTEKITSNNLEFANTKPMRVQISCLFQNFQNKFELMGYVILVKEIYFFFFSKNILSTPKIQVLLKQLDSCFRRI